jgi:DnaJ-domain-containing protein 1
VTRWHLWQNHSINDCLLRRRKDEQQGTWRRGERPHERKIKSDDVEAKDWWVVLGKPEATLEAAKRAYRSNMKQYHPDKMAGFGHLCETLFGRRVQERIEAHQEAIP